MTTRIFLSYGRGDDDPDFHDPQKSFMRRLYNGLKTAGFEIWWDRENLPSRALTFLEEIRNAVDSCDKLVLVVGEKGIASDYVRAEWEYALSICKNVVPILRNGTYQIMPPEIALANAPDFRDLSQFDHWLADLVRILNEDTAPMGVLHGVSELPRGYIERKADMQAVSALIRSDAVKPTVVTAAQGRATSVYGLGGIGKTVLTQALSHDCDLRRSFPDGIIWLEIGKTPLITSRQADIGEIFGDSRDKYIDEQTGKSRLSQILSDKRALIILDDVWVQEHVEPFRVFAQGCRLLMSTRNHRLANLLGANNHELDKLSENQGIQLIAVRFGKTVDDVPELETLREIVNLLDGHTLAISIAASKLEEHGIDYAPRLLERMRSQREGENPFLDLVLDDSDRNSNLELSLSLTYDDLNPDLKHRFHALGILAPDADFDTKLSAAIWNDADADVYKSEDALNGFCQVGLLTREKQRYSQHGLVRAYAHALLTRASEIESHFNRYADNIIKLSEGFDKSPPEQWNTLEIDTPHILYIGDSLQQLYKAGGKSKFDLEGRAVQFALNITNYLGNRREIQRVTWLDMGLAISRRLGEQKCEAMFLNDLGAAYDTLGEKEKALEYYQQAVHLFHAIDEKNGEGNTLSNIGAVYRTFGETKKALEYYEKALLLLRTVSDKAAEARTLHNIGIVYEVLGEKSKALDYSEQSLALSRMIGDRGAEATTLNAIGVIYRGLGQHKMALQCFEQALLLRHAVGDKRGEAFTLNNMGTIYFGLGEKRKALDYYEQALQLRRVVSDRSGEATSLNNLGATYYSLDEKQTALDYFEQALPILRAVGNRAVEMTTLNNIAVIYSDLGEIAQSAEVMEQITHLAQTMGHIALEAAARRNRAIVLRKLNRIQEAIVEIEQSITLLTRHNLPQDEAGQTLEMYEALLEELRGKS